MHSQHIPMTMEEFKLMPWKPGWKYEYWDGQTHISPRRHVVVTTVEVKTRFVNSLFRLRPVKRNDASQLITAYLEAFQDTIEYCDWEPEKIADSANTTIRDFFAGKRGNPLPVSCLAVGIQSNVVGNELIGAALFVKKDDERPLLDILFVLPKWQRKGLATTLVSAALNELYNNGVKTLKSLYMLGNEASLAWHRKFGFKEEPDLFLARVYYHHADHELWRREKLGKLTKTERQILTSEVQQWKAQVDKLETIAEQNGMEAVLPLLRK
jgi:RimJ/RimL family protein N-acetyltransferase